MSDNSISTVTAGKIGFVQQVNQYFSAFVSNLLPRNSAGVVVDLAGTLGESSRRWLNIFAQAITMKGNTTEIGITEGVSSYDALTYSIIKAVGKGEIDFTSAASLIRLASGSTIDIGSSSNITFGLGSYLNLGLTPTVTYGHINFSSGFDRYVAFTNEGAVIPQQKTIVTDTLNATLNQILRYDFIVASGSTQTVTRTVVARASSRFMVSVTSDNENVRCFRMALVNTSGYTDYAYAYSQSNTIGSSVLTADGAGNYSIAVTVYNGDSFVKTARLTIQELF